MPLLASILRQTLLAIVGVGILISGALWPSNPPGPPGPPPEPQPNPHPYTVDYDFEGGIISDGEKRYFLDTIGKHQALVEGRFGGEVVRMDHRQGDAVKFPLPCDEKKTPPCPRAIIEITDSHQLNPGTSDFSYGAEILMKASEIRAGANIIHKGVGKTAKSPGNIWRIELSSTGNVGCFLADTRVAQDPFRASSEKAIADGEWHTVKCTKSKNLFTITVDNTVSPEINVPSDLSIDNTKTVKFGGTGINPSNEQFSGALDNVSYHIE